MLQRRGQAAITGRLPNALEEGVLFLSDYVVLGRKGYSLTDFSSSRPMII